MARDLNQFDFYSLWSGGADGGIVLDGSDDLTGAKIHLIEVLVDDTEFTTLTNKTQAGASVNMLTGINNYAGKTWKAGKLIPAPFGGYIDTVTADQDVRHFKFPGTNRKLNEA